MNPVKKERGSKPLGKEKFSPGLKINIKNLQKNICFEPEIIKKIICSTLALEKVKKTGEISIYFLNDKEIKKLNLRYLNKNSPTDVIVFDLTEKYQDRDYLVADIMLSTRRAIVNAGLFKTTPLSELYLYVIHGLLHLLGYNDKKRKEKKIMDKKADEILERFKICR